jgi:hypothetical protein
VPKSNEKLISDVKEALLTLPSDEDRLAFIHELLNDACMICGKVTNSVCYCSSNYDE